MEVRSGGHAELIGGKVSGLVIDNGASIDIGAHQTLVVSSGMSLKEMSAGSGGTIVMAGGNVEKLTFGYRSTEVVASGGSISGQYVHNYSLILSSGGSAQNLRLGYATSMTLAGGVLSGLTMDAESQLNVVSGATIENFDLRGQDVSLNISSGASAVDVRVGIGGTETV